MSEDGFRSGFVSLVGRTNVGKSTLLNALLGRKVSIVTPKPQTTRHRIHGVLDGPNAQIVFVDAPGLHPDRGRAINRAMNRAAMHGLAAGDVVLVVAEASRWTGGDDAVLERLEGLGAPVVLALNKTDLVRPREALLPMLEAAAARHDFAAIVPVSARNGDNLEKLVQVLVERLPPGPPLYPRGQLTDRDERFRVAEVVREKLMIRLQQELPYSITVTVEDYVVEEEGVHVSAVIWVERDSHKAIVIGHGGTMLKTIGREARLELDRDLGRRVDLRLWVKVRQSWADNERDLRSFGYEPP